MKILRTIGVVALLAIIGCFFWLRWKHDEPRRQSVQVLQNLAAALKSDPSRILNVVVVPRVLIGRTQAEREEFISKALREEISEDGIVALENHASFGPLNELFPKQGPDWAKQAGVNPANCFAFKMEHAGVRAEVVLVLEGKTYRVVRCDNVKQMALREGGA